MSFRGLFITATDTGVGKTTVAAAIIGRLRAEGHRVGAYKPAVSGALDLASGPSWPDVEILASALGEEYPTERICPQRFLAPLAPPVAARLEGKSVDADLLRRGIDWWREHADTLIVEGAGGLLCPLTEHETIADLAKDLGFPLIVVARAGLGTINHTLLTLEVAQNRGLRVAGVVLNHATPHDADDLAAATNSEELSKRTTVPVVGVFPYCAAGDLLREESFRRIDWCALL